MVVAPVVIEGVFATRPRWLAGRCALGVGGLPVVPAGCLTAGAAPAAGEAAAAAALGLIAGRSRRTAASATLTLIRRRRIRPRRAAIRSSNAFRSSGVIAAMRSSIRFRRSSRCSGVMFRRRARRSPRGRRRRARLVRRGRPCSPPALPRGRRTIAAAARLSRSGARSTRLFLRERVRLRRWRRRRSSRGPARPPAARQSRGRSRRRAARGAGSRLALPRPPSRPPRPPNPPPLCLGRHRLLQRGKDLLGRTEPRRGRRDAQHVVLARDLDVHRRRHPGLQLELRVGNLDHGLIRDDVLHRRRLQADLLRPLR